MTTLRAAARAARDRLLAARVSDSDVEAEIEAEVLLRHAIDPAADISKAYLHARYEDQLEPIPVERFDALLARRLAREPTAYITGHREFYGLDFRVTPDVLIPRPETELLVESAIQAVAPGTSRCRLRIADIGTGSGAIAVSLARALPNAEVIAVDLSRRALEIAAENAKRHGAERRIAFRAGYLLTPLCDYVDLIVANLPYVTSDEWLHLEPELREHEPRLALDGGNDGLDLIRQLFSQAFSYLLPGGCVLLEIGEDQVEPLAAFVETAMPVGTAWQTVVDFRGVQRVFVVRPVDK